MIINAGFVTAPESTTVYLGEEASFVCAINLNEYSTVLWYVTEDYTLHYLLPPVYGAHTSSKQLPNNLMSSVLTISAHETTNNTLVVCRGNARNGQDIYSADSYMKIQGMLHSHYRPCDARVNLKLVSLPCFNTKHTCMC